MRAMNRVVATLGVLCLTAGMALAQTTTSSSETKAFEVLAVDGNVLVVSLPEGTREMTVPEDFRFTVNGQPLSVRQLKPGMKGTAVITTKTTVTPVTVTQVKSGTVMQNSGSSIIVRTDEGIKMFTQGDADKRGVRDHEGRPARADIGSASRRPVDRGHHYVKAAARHDREGSHGDSREDCGSSRARQRQQRQQRTAAALPGRSRRRRWRAQGQAPSTGAARTLPSTASSWPAFGLASVLLLAMGCALKIRRRFVQ